MFGLSMTSVPSYIFVTEKHWRISGNKEADDGHCKISLAPEKEPGVRWKSVMTFRSRRVDDRELKATDEEKMDAALSPSPSPQRSEEMSTELETDHMKRSLLPLISMCCWRKSPTKQEIEGDCQPFRVSTNEAAMNPQFNSSCESNHWPKVSPMIEQQKSSPKLWGNFLSMGPPPQSGRPLSPCPTLAVCSPLCDGSTTILPVTKTASPCLVKRKQLWSSDDRGRKNKRKVMCMSTLEQSVYDAAVTITMISMTKPPLASNRNTSLVEPLETVPHAVQLALPSPPFYLWQSNN